MVELSLKAEALQSDERTSFFLVMPGLPYNGLQLYGYSAPSLNWGNHALAQGYVGNIVNSISPPPPYVIYTSAIEAHKKAQELSKQHNSPYYVSQINVLGQYVPPPPEWKPTYSDVWAKP